MNGGALQSTYCIGCGQCAEHCPTGALTERDPRMKPITVKPEIHDSVCSYCGVGCRTKIFSYGNAPIKVIPRAGGSLPENILCRHGRFGWHTAMGDSELTGPLVKKNGNLSPASFEEAYSESIKKLRQVQSQYGKDSVAVLIADRMTSEEIFLSRKLGEALETDSIYSANIYNGGLEDVFGLDGSTNSYRELSGTDLIFILGADVPSYYAMLAVPVQQAVKKGAKLLLAASEGWNGFNMLADKRAVVEDDTRFLKEMLKSLIELGCSPDNAAGFEELRNSLSAVSVSPEAMEFAKALQFRNLRAHDPA
jgi:predicted molibdopterin-dependent oxidoreductase YjgC